MELNFVLRQVGLMFFQSNYMVVFVLNSMRYIFSDAKSSGLVIFMRGMIFFFCQNFV